MNKILQGLNAAQKAAVTSSASVLQVLAPPGSGKTKTLTSRVAYLLAHEQYAPWNVICCTFTIKASREMRERLRGMIGEQMESKLILGTFHSVCRRYLVAYGHLIGIPKNFGVADSDDSLNIVKRTVKRLKLSIDPKTARSRISHRKARGKRLEDLPKVATKNVDAQEFATVFQEYEDALALSNLLDYDDLLMRCVDLLKQHPECVSNIEALLIDEFQDTNVVQFELMKLLASANRRITIVGDPDQSIYGFRSAEIENLRRMKAFYRETVIINLEENYRSASAVLKLAQEIIEQDNDRPPKKLKSTHRYGTLPVLRKLPNPHEEAQWIVSEIKRITAMTGDLIGHNDIAILLRSAFLSLLIEKALANAGIPYRMVGGRRFFDRVEVRILLDYLRTVSHPDNTSALLAIINTPARKVGDATVKELAKAADQKKESLWSVLNKVLGGQMTLDKKLPKPAEQGIRALVSLIDNVRRKMKVMKPEEVTGKVIELIINQLGYHDFLKKQYPEDHGERWENVRELLTQATDASLHLDILDDELPIVDGVVQQKPNGVQEVLSRFLANVVLSTEVESNNEGEQKPRITISTIHSAKGLEWPVVFVPAVYEGSIPHSRAEDTNEERRLLYVALTRAQALLYMTFPVMQSRDNSESILSQFLSAEATALTSQTGPAFSDRVIEETASILRRPPPSQESLAKGHLSIKDHQSQLDDVWPEDGSHKRPVILSDRDTMSFLLQRGQSLSDALRSDTFTHQRSHFSTHSYTKQAMVTDMAANAASSMAIGFTTANHHLRTMPQQDASKTFKTSLVKSASDGAERMSKRPKLTHSASGQGNITAFLNNRGDQQEQRNDTTFASNGKVVNVSKSTPTDLRERPTPVSSIPAALLGHKVCRTPSLLKRQPWEVSSDSSKISSDAEGKRKLTSSLDSTTTELHSRYLQQADEVSENSGRDNQTVTVFTSVDSWTAPATSMSSLKTGTFHSSQVSRLGCLSPLNNMQGTIGGQRAVASQKTLGVKRSMSGWENRKHK